MANVKPPASPVVSPRPFLDLADLYEQRGEPKMRDRFLILAADAAFASGQTDEAERLMQRLVQLSPHHLLKAYHTFAEALQAEPVRTYLTDLHANYPPDTVENLLESLRSQGSQPSAPPKPMVVYSVAGSSSDETAMLPPEAGARRPPSARQEQAETLAVPPRKGAAAKSARRSAAPAAAVPAAPQRKKERRPSNAPGGGWFSSFLFLVVLLAALTVVVYSLGRPFLPQGWLP